MGKFIKTIILNIKIFFESYFTIPFIISFFLAAFYVLLAAIICKKRGKKTQIFSLSSIILVFFCLLYFSELFYITLFSRLEKTTDGLSDVFGEWTIFDGETSMYMNVSPILNVVLFVPLCFLIFYFLKKMFDKVYSDKKILVCSLFISFSMSLFIELIQLIFNKGTFQLSDLTYNTAGGILGAVIYVLTRKIIGKIRKKIMTV